MKLFDKVLSKRRSSPHSLSLPTSLSFIPRLEQRNGYVFFRGRSPFKDRSDPSSHKLSTSSTGRSLRQRLSVHLYVTFAKMKSKKTFVARKCIEKCHNSSRQSIVRIQIRRTAQKIKDGRITIKKSAAAQVGHELTTSRLSVGFYTNIKLYRACRFRQLFQSVEKDTETT